MTDMDVCVVGLGYIGLPTATVLASCGLQVVGVDVRQDTVDTINAGKVHIVEPDLDDLLLKVVTNGALRATTKPERASAFIIAVPTPFRAAHEPDLRFVEEATRAIAPVLEPGNVVLLESTSPVGTTEAVARWLGEERSDLTVPGDVAVAYCPERVLPGKILKELVQNDRVIGGLTAECARVAASLYARFVKGQCILTDARTAELCKLTENSFRDVNIAFANELSMICEKMGVDVWELINLTNHHPRVNVLQPGPGVGGHCIAVDPWFIVHSCPEEARLIRQARLVNDGKPDWVIRRVSVRFRALDRAAELRGDPGHVCLFPLVRRSARQSSFPIRQGPGGLRGPDRGQGGSWHRLAILDVDR